VLKIAHLIVSLVAMTELVLACFFGAGSVFTIGYVTPSGVYVKA